MIQKYSGVQTRFLSDSISSNLGMRSGGGGEVESRRGLRVGEEEVEGDINMVAFFWYKHHLAELFVVLGLILERSPPTSNHLLRNIFGKVSKCF